MAVIDYSDLHEYPPEPEEYKIPSETAKHIQEEESSSLAKAQDDRTTNSTKNNTDEYDTLAPNPQTAPTNSGTAQLGPFSGNVKPSEPEPRSEQLQLSPPRQVRAKVSKKREDPDDDASDCSGASVDSSEEGDDGDYECDNITTWNYSEHDALPSFLPYIRGYNENTSSPCSDSQESGSTTSRTASDTPPSSSASGLAGGNGLQGNRYIPPTAGTGFPDSGNNPVLEIKDGFGAKAADPKPFPFVCWYFAAGIACTAKHVKISTEVRYLWNSVELEELNREPNRLGISRECKKAIKVLRNRIDKETKGGKPPAFHDDDTMTLLKQRVDSNVSLYINGSDASEKTARSELWKWYLIFKKLRPDDELPRNPFISAQRLSGLEERPRADARRMFMRNLDQEECLSELDDDQRTALGRVFFNTLGMLGANEADERHRSVQKRRNPRKRQKLSPPEHHGHAPASTNVILAPTTPALAPAPIAVEFPSSVSNPVDCQHPTFTLPEVQNQLLPQTPSFVPQSFMSSADDFWQMQQQQEAEDAHSLFSTGNFNNTNPSTDYEGLQGFGTQEY
ncbi:unnamed protein product [Alternaria alternata]